MKTKMTAVFLVTFMSAAFLAVPVYGEEMPVGADEWKITFTPYLWAAEVDADITLKGRTGNADISFSDILNDLNGAGMGHFEAWHNKWGVLLDGMYMDVGTDFSTPQGVVSSDMDLTMWIVEFGMIYHLWESPVGKDGTQKLSFDLLGGGRYFNLDTDLKVIPNGPLSDIVGTRRFDRRNEWVDPMVGGRLTWDIDPKLAIVGRFDFGGFGIGSSSTLTWNIVAFVNYQLSKSLALQAGYRLFDIDYSTGSGTNEFGFDGKLRGPILGLTFIF